MALPPTAGDRQRQMETPAASILMMEKHFTIAQLAEQWGFSTSYVGALFIDEPGIIRTPGKRQGIVRIPASVAERVYKRMLAAGGAR